MIVVVMLIVWWRCRHDIVVQQLRTLGSIRQSLLLVRHRRGALGVGTLARCVARALALHFLRVRRQAVGPIVAFGHDRQLRVAMALCLVCFELRTQLHHIVDRVRYDTQLLEHYFRADTRIDIV
jgi:hypothetical protein